MSDIKWKDPHSLETYTIDWQYELASGDTISTATWSASPTELSIVSSTKTSTTTSIQIADGVEKTYEVVCRVTTASGLIKDRSLYVIVRSQ